MAGGHADISKHVKAYIGVFIALAIATVITVLASTVDFGGHVNIGVALLIAVIKASLVAAIFMHLKWERSGAIWWTLGLCAIFFAALIMLPVLTESTIAGKHGTWTTAPATQEDGHKGVVAAEDPH